jgi:hypothetical protein
MSVTNYQWTQRNIPEDLNFSIVTVTAQNFGLQPLMSITVMIYLTKFKMIISRPIFNFSDVF